MNIDVNVDVQVDRLEENSVSGCETTNKGGGDKIDEKVIYEKLWRCRDLEIEHYWHRMVFMTAFMVLCFAGYGGFFIACISTKCQISISVCHLIAFVIALIGIVLSNFWVMMGKGSKAWYEEYENVIKAFVDERECEKREYAGLAYEQIKLKKVVTLDNTFWSTSPGSYSVSKIGIKLGHLAYLIWVVIAICHLTYVFYRFSENDRFQMILDVISIKWVQGGVSLIVSMGVLWGVSWVILKWAKYNLQSSYFESSTKKKEN